MKRFFQLLMCLCLLNLSFPVHAASVTPPIESEDTLVLATMEDYNGKAQYLYDRDGYLMQEDYPDQMRTIYYTYNADRVVTHKNDLSPDITHNTEYDSYGNPIYEVSIDSNGRKYNEFIWENRYDKKGRLIQSVKSDPDGYCQETVTYTYNHNGSFKVEYDERIFSGDPDNMTPHCHRTGWFTKDGTLYRLEDDLQDMGAFLNTTNITLNKHGDPVRSVQKSDGKPAGFDAYSETTTIYEHIYSKNGRLIQTEVYTSRYEKNNGSTTSTPSTLERTISYVYNSDGRIELELHTFPNWDFTIETRWTYDEYGNLLTRRGQVPISDLDYFFQGKGAKDYEVEETYTYQPLRLVRAP